MSHHLSCIAFVLHTMGSGQYAMSEVARHKTKTDCWVAIDGKVYDVTKFLDDHPGGKKAILIYAGKDATEQFMMMHRPEILTKYGEEFKIGVVKGSSKL
eukprot:m.170615 g.170615  ORF g.170615 m.170615 type:complete len:99 (+) comp13265_c0_seq1:2-298(+)